MKKITLTLMCVVAVAVLAACGGTSSDNTAPAETTPRATSTTRSSKSRDRDKNRDADYSDQISVESYSCEASWGGDTRYALISTNNSPETVRIDANVVLKDENGTIIEVDDGFDTGVASGESLCLIFTFDGYDERWTFEPKVRAKSSSSESRYNDVIVDYHIAGSNVIITSENSSDEDVESIEAKALFFMDGNLVGTDSTSWDLEAHDTTVKQLEYYHDFDDVKLYVHSVDY